MKYRIIETGTNNKNYVVQLNLCGGMEWLHRTEDHDNYLTSPTRPTTVLVASPTEYTVFPTFEAAKDCLLEFMEENPIYCEKRIVEEGVL